MVGGYLGPPINGTVRLYVRFLNIEIDLAAVPEFIRHREFRSSIVFDSHKYVFIFFAIPKAFHFSPKFRF